MAKHGKRHRILSEKLKEGEYLLSEAIAFLKENTSCKFDETVDIAMNLNLDPRKAEQQIRGMLSLPEGTGKKVVIAVFAKGDTADQARSAGADFVGGDDLAEKIQKDGVFFDVCIASPDMMGVVGKIGKILGPRGVMPNPKLGTVTQNVSSAVRAAKSGQVEYRLDKGGVVHSGLCKISFSSEKLEKNIKAFISEVIKVKPAGVKGGYVKKITLSTTMGVGLPISVSEVYNY